MIETIEKRSAGGIVISDGKILAIRAIPQEETLFPKGTIEEGETPEQTAVREVLEETGYKTKIRRHLAQLPTSSTKKTVSTTARRFITTSLSSKTQLSNLRQTA